MSFRDKLLLYKSVTIFLVIASLLYTYFYFKSEYEKEILRYVSSEVEFYKQDILLPLENATLAFRGNHELFEKIHKDALRILQQNPNYDLNKLKNELSTKYHLGNIKLDIFFIDKMYKIYKATFKKDINFQMIGSKYVRNILKQVAENDKIYRLESAKLDAIDLGYKTYLYSKLDKNNFLELSFTDSSIKNLFLNRAQKNHIKAEIYNIHKRGDEYMYSNIKENRSFSSKQEFYNSLEKFKKNSPKSDNVMSVFFTNKDKIIKENNNHIVYTMLFDEKKVKNFSFRNVVLKLSIDTSNNAKFLQSISFIFMGIFFMACLILLFLFITSKKFLENPIKIITEKIKNAQEIPTDEFSDKNNEFFIIAKAYNALFLSLQKQIQKNQELIYIDYLTNANNKKAFDEQVCKLISEHKRYKNVFSIMLFDIDDFKGVNDEFGHQVGDDVLVKIVNLIKTLIRKSDSIYRVGGEEFAIIFTQTSLKGAKISALNIKESIKKEFKSLRKESITISSGLCEVAENDDIDKLYKRVDSLQYISKNSGKDTLTCE